MSSNKISVKSINQNLYLYSWEYIPSHMRKPFDSRYHWRYVGSIDSKEVQYFLSHLPTKEQKKATAYIQRKKEELEAIEKYKQKLLSEEPYRTQQKKLMSINNRHNRLHQLKQLDKRLKKIAREKVNN